MEQLLLRPGEAAEAMGISRSKVYELLASGELPSIRVGKSVRIPADRLRVWIAAQFKSARTGRGTRVGGRK
jgi:excisionase family DNA binding protein